jgi:hypothetical protein
LTKVSSEVSGGWTLCENASCFDRIRDEVLEVGMPRCNPDHPQAPDLRREGGRALREIGLHLSARNRHLPLPGGRAADLALHHCRARADAQPVLVQQLRRLRDEGHVRGKGAAWDAAQRGRPWACVRTFDLSSAALRASSQR